MYDNIVSWAVTVDWQAWAMFAQAAAIFGAAWLARDTFQTWRAQQAFIRKREIAEAALTAFHEGTKAISEIRDGRTDELELSAAKSKVPEGVSDQKSQHMQHALVTLDRIKTRRATFDRIQGLQASVFVLFGQSTADSLIDPYKAAQEINSAANMLLNFDMTDEFTGKMYNRIWKGYGTVDAEERDKVTRRLEESQKNLSDALSSYVHEK